MSNEVGFGFQADVVNTASLAHMLTGRVLKALSDGGVDEYAVTATFWMGVKIPIRSSLSETVHAHISKRPSYQSVLSKALKIGWGHSAPVVEMTRTRAGTNGLLIVGAFATGVMPYQAAQCLSELLNVYDIGIDMLPSVDVLVGLVRYLAPFVHDLGFSKVLQHITHVCEGAMAAENRAGKAVIKELGSPSVLAAAVKQLVYTSQMCQNHYMILGVRGSWLPAFASHLLGMSVEVRFGDKIIWASGGDKGGVVFQLADHHMEQYSIQALSMPLTIVERTHDGNQNKGQLSIDCSLENAIESQCLRWPQLDADIVASIHAAVGRLSLDFLSSNSTFPEIQLNQNRESPHQTRHKTMQAFFEVKALQRVLEAMKINQQLIQSTELFPRKVKILAGLPSSADELSIEAEDHAIGFMEQKSVERMASLCDRHRTEAHSLPENDKDLNSSASKNSPVCICQQVGRLIYGCAFMASTLARCNFDASHLRVQESVMIGEFQDMWFRSSVRYKSSAEPFTYEYMQSPMYPESRHYLYYLSRLLCNDYDESWMRHLFTGTSTAVLGFSGRVYTIIYTCLMENECYDDLGRMISIRTGQASLAGSFRNAIIEDGSLSRLFSGANLPVVYGTDDTMDDLDLSWLARKCLLQPHRRPPRSKAFVDVALRETAILVNLRRTLRAELMVGPGQNFTDCITTFLTMWLVPRCDHPTDSVYEVPTDHMVAVGGFYLEGYMHKLSEGKVVLFALRGNKLEQLLTCGVGFDESRTENGDGSKPYGVLQLQACLTCCIKLAQNSEICQPYVVMGG